MSKEKKDIFGKDYVCSQCGADPNGMEVHAMVHHQWPPMTVEEAKAEIKKLNEEKP